MRTCLRLSVLLTFLLLALGCRYNIRSTTPPHIRRVRVDSFKNATDKRNLSFELITALKRELRSSAGIKIVTKDADGLISGRILSYTKKPLIEDTRDRIIESQIIITAEISFRDVRNEKWIIRKARTSNSNINHRSGIYRLTPEGSGEDSASRNAVNELARALMRVIETESW